MTIADLASLKTRFVSGRIASVFRVFQRIALRIGSEKSFFVQQKGATIRSNFEGSIAMSIGSKTHICLVVAAALVYGMLLPNTSNGAGQFPNYQWRPPQQIRSIPYSAPPRRVRAVPPSHAVTTRPARRSRGSRSVPKPTQQPAMSSRLPGEFEQQRAILLSLSDWQPHHYYVLQQVVEHTSGHIALILLYNGREQLSEVVRMLMKTGKAYPHLLFAPLKLDTIWLRDYCPRIAQTSKSCVALDFLYLGGSRPLDEKLPLVWSQRTNIRHYDVPWSVQGGNLLTNGHGIAITSNRLYEDNQIKFHQHTPRNPELERRKIVVDDVKAKCNLSELLVLEPLNSEMTKHVDMFATFLAKDRVLLAQLDPASDPGNSAILERNAYRMSQLKVDGRPMRVERIRIPSRHGIYWSPYTNIILANKLVLMPTLKTDDPSIKQAAIDRYHSLLPGRTVKTVDMTSMRALQGSLHCISMNLPKFAPWPERIYRYGRLVKSIKTNRTTSKPSR